MFVCVCPRPTLSRWLHRDNPDPNGFHLKRVADAARLYVYDDGPTSLYHGVFEPLGYGRDACDFGLFWDFASLYQGRAKNPQMAAAFKEGLKLSNVWYGHRYTLFWSQTALPSKFVGQDYGSSGWCYVEASLSSVLKPSATRLDLGLHKLADKTYERLRANGVAGRMPPVTPDVAAREIREHKKFTNSADKATVIRLYETFFVAVAPRLRALRLPGLGWGDEQALALCGALTHHFSHLFELDVRLPPVCAPSSPRPGFSPRRRCSRAAGAQQQLRP